MASFHYLDKGTIDYQECWDMQEQFLSEVVASKKETGKPTSKNYFLFG